MSKKNNKFKKMSDKNKNSQKPIVEDPEIEVSEVEEVEELQDAEAEVEMEVTENEKLQAKITELDAALAKEKKEYLFLMAEFDNFRKRTLKEKSEILKNGAESAMKNLLPVIDDFERGVQALEESNDAEAIKEGLILIYNKFIKYLEQNGVKPIATENATFDTELHEAVTTFPAADDSMKGKIMDTIQKGYTLNDKILRHAKVVVGQ